MINLNFLKFKKDLFKLKNISRISSDFWDKHSKFLFFLFSLVILFLGVYFWFQMNYRSDWNSDQKKQYADSQSKEIELKEQQLKKVVEEFERRKGAYSAFTQVGRDIFASFAEENQEEKDLSIDQESLPNNNVSVNDRSSI